MQNCQDKVSIFLSFILYIQSIALNMESVFIVVHEMKFAL